jgi:hypothetical protein
MTYDLFVYDMFMYLAWRDLRFHFTSVRMYNSVRKHEFVCVYIYI